MIIKMDKKVLINKLIFWWDKWMKICSSKCTQIIRRGQNIFFILWENDDEGDDSTEI